MGNLTLGALTRLLPSTQLAEPEPAHDPAPLLLARLEHARQHADTTRTVQILAELHTHPWYGPLLAAAALQQMTTAACASARTTR